MEEAVLRPPRRPTRRLFGLLAVLASLGLIWPAGIVMAGPSRLSGSSLAAGPTASSDRSPTIAGRGVKPVDAGRGQHPDRPLQKLPSNFGKRMPRAAGTGPSVRGAAPASVLATNSGAPVADSFGWSGYDQAVAASTCAVGQPDSCDALEPPDPWVAVGPDDVVQSVNTDLRFTTREGVPTADNLDAFEFFRLSDVSIGGTVYEVDGYGDPRFVYDQRHNRWLGSLMGWHCDDDTTGPDTSHGFMFGAISTTADPTGDYYQFIIAEAAVLHDYPMIGTSADKFTVASNDFELAASATCLTSVAVGATLGSFSWAQMLLFPASPNPDFAFYTSEYFSPRPAVSPQGQGNAIVGVIEIATSATSSNVNYFKITGTVNGQDSTTLTNIDLTAAGVIAPFTEPPTPVDPGGPIGGGTSPVDRRPTDAVWQDNILTFTTTAPCDPAGGGAETRDCARVAQLDTSTATPTLVQDMLIGTTAKDTWYPGIGQSQSGILHVVYSQSSSTEGISSYDRYQLPANAVNTLSAPLKIADGGVIDYLGDRWGDYVGVAQDPRDTNAVWQGNQYTKSDGTWATRVSELQTAGSTFIPIAPVRLLDSRFNNGTVGPFTSSVPKTVDIAGRAAIPNDAVAITGNLTVVGQQQAGYASLTPLPVANPATSTINFPLGDNRANNITSPLSNAGGVSLTYKATPGKQTHFILDVTGYFLNRELSASNTYNVLTPVRVLDTRSNTGLSGRFQANVNRTFQVAGVLGIPATAKAITGNLTVANQTTRGYVTLATDPPAGTPTTSTLNFPVGDARANGVTVKLSSTGKLTAVYVATAGNTTHLILDVTGYYMNDLNGARFIALTPGRRMDTRGPAPREGLAGAFTANVSRTLVIEPYQGVPANATAITGNLTVVGQSRAGYVSMTQIATNSPATSTINFPLGDIRANGVTGPLSGAGSVGLVYKTSGGLTHLILDVTGYFR
jgi:hypothetical protein